MSADTDVERAKAVATRFWNHFHAQEWNQAEMLLAEEGFEACWPQSREKFLGRSNFIEVNRTYPGQHRIEIQDVKCEADRWDHTYSVVTVVRIESKMPDGKDLKLFATSFFEIDSDEKITSITEYWADCYDAPDWRKHLVERY